MQREVILNVEDLKKYFPLRTGLTSILSRQQQYVKAVDGVTFRLARKEILGIVGESGCGKTTTARMIVRLIEPTRGRVIFEGVDVTTLQKSQLRDMRRRLQIIFQDPYESLNPRRTVAGAIRQSIDIHRLTTGELEKELMVKRILKLVELDPPEQFTGAYPHEISGGQRQRVAIARALVLEPRLVVADEPVSMLDVSTRAGILDLILKLKDEFGISVIYITHDLATARYICDRLAVMYLGKIVELGEAEKVLEAPLHPYTRALISAVPVPNPTLKMMREKIPGEPPSPTNLPSGCRFHPRCPLAISECSRQEPALEEIKSGHQVACLRAGDSG